MPGRKEQLLGTQGDRWATQRTFGPISNLACSPRLCVSGAEPALRPRRVLVADDEDVSRKALALMLRRLGCETEEAATGLGALRALAERRYDVVFLDLHMPEMDGFATARFISKHWTVDIMPKLAALVGDGAKGDREEASEAGFTEFAVKPFRQEDMERILGPA